MALNTEKKPRVTCIAIEYPPVNVLGIQLLRELDQALSACAADSTIDVVVLRGAGTRAFSAGMDIRDHTRDRVPEMLDIVHSVIRKLLALPQVTIAAVRGVCFGGGCELASCCDLVVASEDSLFATPEIQVGCYPPVALARFSTLIGYHRAAEMILTGRHYGAREALDLGLINRVFAEDQFDNGLTSLLDELLSKSGAVMRIALKGLRELSLRDFSGSLSRSEEIYCHELLHTEDVDEGVRAFLEKRKPNWKHR
jgi:cyclohexa-1,5-dienecarbonyl-CoA hydratase